MKKQAELTNSSDRELEILRNAVELAEKKVGEKQVNSPEVKKIIEIVEDFLRHKKCVCYGGTAINNLLPNDDKFYDKNIELPDYDFFSSNAVNDAIELANIYHSNGYKDVEAKAGQHFGTYKVFVNYLPVADITHIEPKLFKMIYNDSIKVDGVYYAPPNFLRMSMYLELSRPMGDVSRWEKVFKRLNLLNKNYPIKGEKCEQELFIKTFENDDVHDDNKEYELYNSVKNRLITHGVVFFGGYAFSLYSNIIRKKYNRTPEFDVISEEPDKIARIIQEMLKSDGYKNIKIKNKPSIGEIVSPHIEISVNKKPIVFIYEPTGCSSYNTIKIKGKNIKIATIDTMLSFYLAFLYEDDSKYDKNRILCMAEYLFRVQSKNKFKQYGILKRFSLNCYGNQPTREDMKAEKNDIYELMKDKKGTKDFDEYFLNYNPSNKNKNNDDGDKDVNVEEFKKKMNKRKTTKRKTKQRKTKRKRIGSIEL